MMKESEAYMLNDDMLENVSGGLSINGANGQAGKVGKARATGIAGAAGKADAAGAKSLNGTSSEDPMSGLKCSDCASTLIQSGSNYYCPTCGSLYNSQGRKIS